MPIVAADIDFRLSGGAANSDPNAALGGAKSSTEITAANRRTIWPISSGRSGLHRRARTKAAAQSCT